MLRTRLVSSTVLMLGVVACGQGNTNGVVPPPVADAAGVAGEAASATVQEDSLTGDWQLRSEPPQRLPGLRITIAVDSVRGSRAFGKLTHYFSGDVGGDPSDYEPFTDSLRQDGTVAFLMPTVDMDYPGIAMLGRFAADTIRLATFVLGPDTLSNGPRRWYLVRQR